MARFTDVLDEVEHKAEEAEAQAHSVRVNTSGWSGWMAPGEQTEEPAARWPGEDYGLGLASEGEAPIIEPPGPEAVDLAAELDAGRLQAMSLRDLRALRRRLARHVHPDIADGQGSDIDPQAMARVNQAIDAAIRAQLVGVGRPVRR
jgi:hypothetical protein